MIATRLFEKLLGSWKGTDLAFEDSQLLDAVRQSYSRAADDPAGKHPFPVGRGFSESVGYPAHILDALPAATVNAFVGVSNVSVFADISEGSTVLDIGCGSGLDSLIAAGKAGFAGRVIGVDFSESMLKKAREAAAEAGFEIEFHCCDASQIPLEDGSIDVILVNGIFNLNPKREEIFVEMNRLLKAGGHTYAAELVLTSPIRRKALRNLDDWFS
jgi:SAM-dependent methyltransferase